MKATLAILLLNLSIALRLLSADALGVREGGLRLYVFDCGTIVNMDPARFRFERREVTTTDLSIACFLVSHPKGTLLWDTGAVPDAERHPTGAAVTHRVVFPDGSDREILLTHQLLPQLAESGYSPAAITYLALSHYHWDHAANANAFKNATWLARPEEREAMFAVKPPDRAMPRQYEALKSAKTIVVTSDEYDVFGDGTVILKRAGGHTIGHQVLFIKLAKTGPVVLSGDLYHFGEARLLKRIPIFDVDQAATVASRQAIEQFLAKTGAQLWIQHDYIAHQKLKKAPAFYD